ncbi:MAG: metallophosphoesterase family protein [Phycisphaerales bacterium]|nr:metallophosphoesterase family protein [Phycisphaerales bacterium]
MLASRPVSALLAVAVITLTGPVLLAQETFIGQEDSATGDARRQARNAARMSVTGIGATVGTTFRTGYGGAPRAGQITFVCDDSLIRWGLEHRIQGDGLPPEITVDPTDPLGPHTVRFTAPTNSAFSEIAIPHRYAPTASDFQYRFDEMWATARIYISRGATPMTSDTESLTFFKFVEYGVTPLISLQISVDDRLEAVGSGNIGRIVSQTAVPTDAWTTFTIHWRKSTGVSDGLFEVWMDGQPIPELHIIHNNPGQVGKTSLVARNVNHPDVCSTNVQWVSWGETVPMLQYDPDMLLGHNRDVTQTEAAILVHFHPAQRNAAWLNQNVVAVIRYAEGDWPADGETGVLETGPVPLDAWAMYSGTATMSNLTPGTSYSYQVRLFPESDPGSFYETSEARGFQTMPNEPTTIRFGWAVGHDQGGLAKPYQLYHWYAQRDYDFVVHLGDYIYTDHGTSATAPATTTAGYLLEYLNASDDRYMHEFTQHRALFMMWDDHEVWDAFGSDWRDPLNMNPSGADPTVTEYELFIRARLAFNTWFSDGFLDLPVPGTQEAEFTDREYYRSWQTARCNFILLDTRSFQDVAVGTMIGPEQKAWLLDELASNTKPFVFMLSPSTWGDVIWIFDNWHYSPFRAERDAIETFFQEQTSTGYMFILTGDRHASFVHTRFDESRIICEADSCPASAKALWCYDPAVEELDGVLFASIDGADPDVPQWAHMGGEVVVDETTGEVTITIIDADDGSDMFSHTFTIPFCPADLNDDGVIGQPDLGILLAAYSLSAEGDIDGDGDTDQADLGLLLQDYDTACPR